MAFQLKILGSNSAIPAYGRNHSAQILIVNGSHYLIDCGEGTQLQIAKYKGKLHKIDNIFISHLHGDHYLGLLGLISSMHLQSRTKDLNIYGPVGLQEIITVQLKYSQTVLNYKVNLTELDANEHIKIHEDRNVTVHSFPLDHRINCNGFFIKEKEKPLRLIKEKLPEEISLSQIADLKKGMDVVDENGEVIYRNAEMTLPPKRSRSLAYCSDTKYDPDIVKYIAGADLLYHESTFLHENEYWAERTYHSTTKQAASIAKEAKVGKLLLGHFSARYKDLTPFQSEAQEIFKNSFLATEGQTYEVEDGLTQQ